MDLNGQRLPWEGNQTGGGCEVLCGVSYTHAPRVSSRSRLAAIRTKTS